ncbi:MAG: hypothetical protein OXH42_11030 [Acidimicrobiaceae bacterium]|nr:hypothetical protein [Acidimicrobiaceae bacterium]
MARKPKRQMPEPIPDTPENVAKTLMNSPPRKRAEWRYERESDEDR